VTRQQQGSDGHQLPKHEEVGRSIKGSLGYTPCISVAYVKFGMMDGGTDWAR
jgi:hypothetical protein